MNTKWVHYGDKDSWDLYSSDRIGVWLGEYWVPGRRVYMARGATVTLPDDLTLEEALDAAKVIILAQRGK